MPKRLIASATFSLLLVCGVCPQTIPYMPPIKPRTRYLRVANQCVDEQMPNFVQDETRYMFELVRSNAICVDNNGNSYDWGQVNQVSEFSGCAATCVEETRSRKLRGYDWDCETKTCRCLYERDTWNMRNIDRFDSTNHSEDGEGPIKEGSIKEAIEKDGSYCGRLVSATIQSPSRQAA